MESTSGLVPRKTVSSIYDILLDGLSYNMRGYFASCVVFFQPRRGEEKCEQYVREYYMLNHLKRDLNPLQKSVILMQFHW